MAKEKGLFSGLVGLLTRGESLWSLGNLITGTAAYAVLVGIVSQIWPSVASGLVYGVLAAAGLLGLLLVIRAHRSLGGAPKGSHPAFPADASGEANPKIEELLAADSVLEVLADDSVIPGSLGYVVPERLQEWRVSAEAAGSAMHDLLRMQIAQTLSSSNDVLYGYLGRFIVEGVLDRLPTAQEGLTEALRGRNGASETEVEDALVHFLERYASAHRWVLILLGQEPSPNAIRGPYERLVEADRAMRADLARLRQRRDVGAIGHRLAQTLADRGCDGLPTAEQALRSANEGSEPHGRPNTVYGPGKTDG